MDLFAGPRPYTSPRQEQDQTKIKRRVGLQDKREDITNETCERQDKTNTKVHKTNSKHSRHMHWYI